MRSFFVLAVSAAYSAAQEYTCILDDFVPDDNNNDVVGPDPVEPDTVVNINDTLCYARSDDPNDSKTWWNIDNEIQNLRNQITGIRDKVNTAVKCEQRLLTAWKTNYPFECPDTQPTFEDWQGFLPAADAYGLGDQASSARSQASSLRSKANTTESRIGQLQSSIASTELTIVNLQASIAKVDDFKSYWDSNNGNYAEVKAFYDQQQKDFTTAINEAKALVSGLNSSLTTAKKSRDSAAGKLATEQKNWTNALVKYQKTLKPAYDAAVKAAASDASKAKKLYDDAVKAAKSTRDKASTSYSNALKKYNVASKEASYNTAFKNATSSAQKNYDSQLKKIADEQGRVDVAQANLDGATNDANSINDLQTCFESTSVNLWASQDARSTDETIFQSAVDKAETRIKNAQAQALKIASYQVAYDKAVEKFAAATLALVPFEEKLNEAIAKRDADGSAAVKAKAAWDLELANFNSDQTISDTESALSIAQSEYDNILEGSLFSDWQIAITNQTEGSEVLATKSAWEFPNESDVPNYDALQQKISDAQLVLDPLESAYQAILDEQAGYQLQVDAANAAKFAIDTSYYNIQLTQAKKWYDADIKWNKDIEKQATNLKSGYKLPTNPAQSIISALEKWVKGKASASASNSLISTLKKESDYAKISFAIASLDNYTAIDQGTTIKAEDWNTYKPQLDSDVFAKIIEQDCITQTNKFTADQKSNDKAKDAAILKYQKQVDASLKKLDDTISTNSSTGVVTVTKVGYRNLEPQYKQAYDVAELYYQNMLDPIKFRTEKSAELLIKQPELEAARATALAALTSVQDPLGLGTIKIDEDFCTKKATNCVVANGQVDILGLEAANDATIARNLIQAEVDALEKLVYNLSGSSWTTSEQTKSRTARDKAYKTWIDHIALLDKEEKIHALAQQNVEAQRDESALQQLQSDWLSKLSPPRDEFSAECSTQQALRDDYDIQIADINNIVAGLQAEKSDVEKIFDQLTKAGCENTIFYRERLDELRAEINVIEQKIDEARIPLSNDTPLDLLTINYGLNKLRSDASDAAGIACAKENELTNAMKPYTEEIKWVNWLVDTTTFGWCALGSWSGQFFDTSIYNTVCDGNKDKASFEASVDNLLNDRYNSSARFEFATCTGKSITEPNFGQDWEEKARGSLSFDLGKAQCDLTKFQNELSPLLGQPEQWRSEADQLTQQAVDWELRYDAEIVQNSRGKTAQELKNCNTESIADWESPIQELELEIASLLVFRSTKYSSFYSSYQQRLQTIRTQLSNDKTRADRDFKRTNGSLFKVQSFGTSVTNPIPVTTVRMLSLAQEEVVSEDELRLLATYNTSDLDMINFIPYNFKPSGVKLCTGLTYSTDPVTKEPYLNTDLAGVQVFFGEGDNQVYGPAHGNLENGCVDTQFDGKIPNGVQLFTDSSSAEKIQGIRIEFRVAGQYEREVIERGIVDQPGQKVFTQNYDSNDQYQFFGFEARTDDRVPSLVNKSLKPVVYDPVLFAELKQIIDTYPENWAINEENLANVGQTQANWDQEKIYNRVIQSDVISQVAQATSDFKAVEVLRPEQAAVLKSQLSGTSSGGHINEDDSEDTGAIIATIIGSILMLLLAATLIYKCMAKRTFNGFGGKSQATPGRRDNRILVNQSAASDGTRVVAADDIC